MAKNQKSRGISGELVRTIAILAIVIFGYKGIKIAKVSQNLDRQIEEVSKEVATESKKLEELKIEYENIESLHSVERIAREKLGLVKKDEIVFREKY